MSPALETPGNAGALGAPWLIDRDNDQGITVVDNRGYVVWNENWTDLPSVLGRDHISEMIGECRARIHAVVRAINASSDLAKLAASISVSIDKDGNTVISLDERPVVAVIPSPEAKMLQAFDASRRSVLASAGLPQPEMPNAYQQGE